MQNRKKDVTWRKPAIGGAVAGAIAMTIFGFSVMGWTTANSAERSAQDRADTAVASALVPLCIAKAQQDPDAAKLAKFRGEESSYSRYQLVSDAGWATVMGSSSSSWLLARACSDQLFALKS